jgi:hypothetical protein
MWIAEGGEFDGVVFDVSLSCCPRATKESLNHSLLVFDVKGTYETRDEGPGWYFRIETEIGYAVKVKFCPWCGRELAPPKELP